MVKSKTIAVLTIMFLLITLWMTVSMTVNATDSLPTNMTLNDLVISDDDTAAVEANSIAANQIVANEIVANSIVANQIAANSVVQPTIDTNGTNEDSLPQTGVTEDITVMFFVIVCTISAIYAYKKIKEYSE